MSERIGQKIYDSPKWKKLRRMYLESQNYICERCGKPATICHHKEYITASNINDIEVTLNFDNLEALCQECHNKEHKHNFQGKKQRQGFGVAFDENGNLIKKSDVFIVFGAPGSGKTYYVKQHKLKSDLVLDLDYICAALMLEEEIYLNHDSILSVALQVRETIYKCVEKRQGKWTRCWIITSMSDEVLIKALAIRLKAEIIKIDTPLEQCIKNIQQDERRKKVTEVYLKIAREWFESFPSKKNFSQKN